MSAAETVWHGAEMLRPFLVPIDELERHPQNPNRGDVDTIAKSMDRFGQVKPVLTEEQDDRRVIVAGNHRYLAAVQLGWTHVAAIPSAFASSAEARAYMLADNKVAELGEYEKQELLALLEGLEASDGWEGTGWEVDHLEDLRSELDRIAETAPEEFKGGYADAGEQGEERRREIAGHEPMKEVPLTLSKEQYDAFQMHIGIIQREQGLTGQAEAVLAALEAQAA